MHRPARTKQRLLHVQTHFDEDEDLFVPGVPRGQPRVSVNKHDVDEVEGSAAGLVDVPAVRVQEVPLDFEGVVRDVELIFGVLAVSVLEHLLPT